MEHRTIKLFSILLGVILLLTSCYYDNEEELYGVTPCKTQNISYAQDIVPVLQNQCYVCHGNASASSNGAGINLEGYANISAYLNSNSKTLLGAIKQELGYAPMPRGGRLDNCTISQIESWINAGFPNN